MQRLDAASVGLALSLVFVPAEAYSPRSAYFDAGATGATQSQKDFNALKGKARADDKDDRDDHDGTCGDRPLGNRDHGGHQNCDDDELFSISGAINPSEGSAGATVNLGGTASATTTADQKGRYRFEALASGAYVVTPSRDGYAFTPASRFVGITTKAIKEIDFWASPTHALTGTITPAVAGAGGTITLSDGSTTS